jgi:hypothetical protein
MVPWLMLIVPLHNVHNDGGRTDNTDSLVLLPPNRTSLPCLQWMFHTVLIKRPGEPYPKLPVLRPHPRLLQTVRTQQGDFQLSG